MTHTSWLSCRIRRAKLNSQFIVTRFSVLHAGGRSLFRLHISPTATFSMIARDKKQDCVRQPSGDLRSRNYAAIVAGDLDRYQRSAIWSHSPWTTPSIARTIEGDFEIWNFSENRQIDAGGDDKLWIQFASPKGNSELFTLHPIFASSVTALCSTKLVLCAWSEQAHA